MKKVLISILLLGVLLLEGCTFDNKEGYTKCILTDYSGNSVTYEIKDFKICEGDKITLYLKDGSSMPVNGHYRFEK